MSYRIIIPKLVQKQLNNLPQKEKNRIIEAIKLLANQPRPNGVKKAQRLRANLSN